MLPICFGRRNYRVVRARMNVVKMNRDCELVDDLKYYFANTWEHHCVYIYMYMQSLRV